MSKKTAKKTTAEPSTQAKAIEPKALIDIEPYLQAALVGHILANPHGTASAHASNAVETAKKVLEYLEGMSNGQNNLRAGTGK